MHYTVLIKTTFFKEVQIDALDPEEAKAIAEADCLDTALDTDNFDTEITVYK